MEKPALWIGVPVIIAVLFLVVLGLSGDSQRTTKSGVKVTDTKIGTGAEARKGDTVAMHYTGKLANGNQFDSSRGGDPIVFRLGMGEVIPGWDEGIVGMKEGGQRELVIPPEMAYKDMQKGGIPPNSELHFEVELVEIK